MTGASFLRDIAITTARVDPDTPFGEAATALSAANTSALAVVDAEDRLHGLFTHDDLLRGVFDQYLDELHHTAFLDQQFDEVLDRLRETATHLVTQYAQETEPVDVGAGAAHVAERFIHSPAAALAVVSQRRFLGIVEQRDFCRFLVATATERP